MKEDDLIRAFTRVRATALRIFVEVRMVDAEQAGYLAERWTLAATLPPNSPPIDVDRALLRVLADYRYFRTCEICEERRPVGEFTTEVAHCGHDHCRDCVG